MKGTDKFGQSLKCSIHLTVTPQINVSGSLPLDEDSRIAAAH